MKGFFFTFSIISLGSRDVITPEHISVLYVDFIISLVLYEKQKLKKSNSSSPMKEFKFLYVILSLVCFENILVSLLLNGLLGIVSQSLVNVHY
jgi:uncharacterized membrane protein